LAGGGRGFGEEFLAGVGGVAAAAAVGVAAYVAVGVADVVEVFGFEFVWEGGSVLVGLGRCEGGIGRGVRTVSD